MGGLEKMSSQQVNVDISEIIQILDESETIEEARQRFALLILDRSGGNKTVLKLLKWAAGGHIPKPRKRHKK